jgi:hypothetical protein
MISRWWEDAMPVSDRDVYATAKLVIDRQGKSATYYACGRADELLDNGDLEGSAAWRRIAKATEALLLSDGKV